MKTQTIYTAQPGTPEQENALVAFLAALKIKFKTSKETPYNPEFVAKIERSRQQAREGKTVSIDLDEIWKE